jgi:hypothetical protein
LSLFDASPSTIAPSGASCRRPRASTSPLVERIGPLEHDAAAHSSKQRAHQRGLFAEGEKGDVETLILRPQQ